MSITCPGNFKDRSVGVKEQCSHVLNNDVLSDMAAIMSLKISSTASLQPVVDVLPILLVGAALSLSLDGTQ